MKNIIYLIIFTVVSFIGCSGTTKEKNGLGEIEDIVIVRFDREVYEYLKHPESIKEAALKEKYPLLLPAFGRIAMDNSDPVTFYPSLREYFSHPILMQIYKDAESHYTDVSTYEKELSEANVLVSQYLSGRKLPELAMHVSGFRENVIVLNNLISISIDKYLGSEYSMYKEFFQVYEREQMKPEYITRDYLKAWLMSDVVKMGAEEQNLLSTIVAEGKTLYALSMLLPQKEDGYYIGYSEGQLIWCKQNEKMLWQTVVKQNYLFSADNMVITRFVNDAAHTSIVSLESPGRVGCWLGWQIVNQYAKKKNASLQEILNTDAQTILKEAKYNP